MIEQIVLALIVATPATIAAIATLIIALRTNSAVRQVEKQTNGLQKEMRETARALGHAEGRSEQKPTQ